MKRHDPCPQDIGSSHEKAESTQPLQCVKCLYKRTKVGGDEEEELHCRERALCWLAPLILRKSQGEGRENDFA